MKRVILLSTAACLLLAWAVVGIAGEEKAKVQTLEEIERQHVLDVLDLTGWKVSGDRGAAKVLGLKPTTLAARMKKLGIQRET